MTRGLDLSFAYNQASTEADLLTREELVGSIEQALERGGNFLLDVGPRGVDAAIPEEQLTRLRWVAEQRRVPWASPAGGTPVQGEH